MHAFVAGVDVAVCQEAPQSRDQREDLQLGALPLETGFGRLRLSDLCLLTGQMRLDPSLPHRAAGGRES